MPSLYFTVEILFKATGDAPILKKKKWIVPTSRSIGAIIEFLRKYIKCQPQDSLASIFQWNHTNVSVVCVTCSSHYIEYWLFVAWFQFLYVNQSFAPSPDVEVGTLYDVSVHRKSLCHWICIEVCQNVFYLSFQCFGSDRKLVLHYCKSQAWG